MAITFLVSFFGAEGAADCAFCAEAEDLTGADADLSVLLRSFVLLMRVGG